MSKAFQLSTGSTGWCRRRLHGHAFLILHPVQEDLASDDLNQQRQYMFREDPFRVANEELYIVNPPIRKIKEGPSLVLKPLLHNASTKASTAFLTSTRWHVSKSLSKPPPYVLCRGVHVRGFHSNLRPSAEQPPSAALPTYSAAHMVAALDLHRLD